MTAVDLIQEAIDDAAIKAPSKSCRSILVATDGSEYADAAFTAAKLIAEKHGCRVHVLSVVEPLPRQLGKRGGAADLVEALGGRAVEGVVAAPAWR